MPAIQSAFGYSGHDISPGGIVVIQNQVWITATVDRETCLIQRLELRTLQEEGSFGVTMEGETCTGLFVLDDRPEEDVGGLLVLGTMVGTDDDEDKDGTKPPPQVGKAAYFDIYDPFDEDETQPFTTFGDLPYLYPVDVAIRPGPSSTSSSSSSASQQQERPPPVLDILSYNAGHTANGGGAAAAAAAAAAAMVGPPLTPQNMDPTVPSSMHVSEWPSSDEMDVAVWQQDFVASSVSTNVNDTAAGSMASVFPSGIYHHKSRDVLFVVGSTNGGGGGDSVYGGFKDGGAAGGGGTMDGFVAKLEVGDGSAATTHVPSSKRIGTSGQDYILGHCSPANEAMAAGYTDGSNSRMDDQLYVVGTTTSSFVDPTAAVPIDSKDDYRGFISRIDVKSLKQVWTVEFSVRESGSSVAAVKCAVDPTSNYVYVVGTADGPIEQAGDDIRYSPPSAGNDVFVAKVDGNIGKVGWIAQLGSGNDDRVADLALVYPSPVEEEEEGTEQSAINILLYGSTQGSVVGPHESQVELFIVAIDAETGTWSTSDTISVPGLSDDVFYDDDAASPSPTEQSGNLPPTNSPPTLFPSASPSLSTPAPTTPPPTHSPTVAPTPKLQSDASTARDGTGFQSNWGPSYAGAMVYDFTRHAVYFTGATYQTFAGGEGISSTSDCFLGHLPLTRMDDWQRVDQQFYEAAGDKMNLACNAMAHEDDVMWVAGMDESDSKSRNAPQKAFVNSYSRSTHNPDWSFSTALNANVSPSTAQVQLPQAMAVVPTGSSSGKTIVLAMVTSDDSTLTAAYYKIEDKVDHPNLTAGGNFYKRGYQYYVTLQFFRYDPNNVGTKGQLIFAGFAQLQTSPNKLNVYASGMTVLSTTPGQPAKVILVGSIQGATLELPQPPERERADDLDGYAIVVNMARFKWGDGIRLASVDNRNDWVHNICDSPNLDDSSFFVVGSTEGIMPNPTNGGAPNPGGVSAFVSRVNAASMQVEWTTQLYAKSGDGGSSKGRAEAFSCDVVPHDPDVMYVGGVVYDGAVMSYKAKGNPTPKSAGGDDVFVAKLDTSDGSIRWMQQIGSSGKENLARNDGIFADMEGNAIVYGDTDGELYRDRAWDRRHSESGKMSTDVFVVKLSGTDGSYTNTVESSKTVIRYVGSSLAILVVLVSLLGGYWYLTRRTNVARRCMSLWRRRRGQKQDNFAPEEAEAIFKEDAKTAKTSSSGGLTVSTSSKGHTPAYRDNPMGVNNEAWHPNGTLEMSMMREPDGPSYRPGRNFV